MASNTKRRNEVQMNGNVILSSEFNDNDDFKEIKMRKILIIGIALSLILVSGGLFSAQASCSGGCLSWLSPCNWHFPSLCGLSCSSRDVDVAPARVETAKADSGGGCLSFLSPCNWNLSALAPCNWHFPSFCGFGFTCGSTEANSVSARDADRQYVTRQFTPALMGSPGF